MRSVAYTAVIVAAAGQSARMGQPKQQIPLDGVPVLLRTLRTLQAVPQVDALILVARAEDAEDFAALARQDGITKLVAVVPGGDTRQQSVQNGLAVLPPQTTLVGIHDGARPLVTPETVCAVIEKAAETGAAATAIPVYDTLKRADAQGRVTDTPDRTGVWRVQTPQVFAADAYRVAMAQAVARGEDATDDCRLMERAGHTVWLVPGDATNLKVTVPEDIPLAEAILRAGKKEGGAMRIGHGYDVHRLVEGRPLILGGVNIPYEKGLLGHSDADVLTHAVMDAMLGAAALGDIGGMFPDTDPAYAGADSLALLRQVAERIRAAGYAVGNIDATVLAQRPKLKPYIDGMRQRLAEAMGIDSAMVSVKATTEEGLGFTGTGEGIAAHAVCLLEEREVTL